MLRAVASDTWESRLLDASRPGDDFRLVLPREQGHKYTVEHRAGRLVLRTNRQARNFRA